VVLTIRARVFRAIALGVASLLSASVTLGVVHALEKPRDNEEVRRLHDADQADRALADGSQIDWAVVLPRDQARLSRVMELFAGGGLRTANDYYRAAMVLQHGNEPEDFLLAHEFCVVAIVLGKNDKETRWLAASAEDRFLMNIGRPQRFGTQFHSADGGPWKLYQVDPAVTDALRALMGTHPLADAKAREAELNKK
jgi:hypothetical protein